jgi:hypothetical protein
MHVKNMKMQETDETHKAEVNEAAIKGCTAVCVIVTVNPDSDLVELLPPDLVREICTAIELGRKLVLLACTKNVYNSIITKGFSRKVQVQLGHLLSEKKNFTFHAVIDLSPMERHGSLTERCETDTCMYMYNA